MVQRQYRNLPIEEAVCEFRFAPGSAWNLTVPGLFYEKIKDFYTGELDEQMWWHEPLINLGVDSEIVFEWWYENQKITVYILGNTAEYIKLSHTPS